MVCLIVYCLRLILIPTYCLHSLCKNVEFDSGFPLVGPRVTYMSQPFSLTRLWNKGWIKVWYLNFYFIYYVFHWILVINLHSSWEHTCLWRILETDTEIFTCKIPQDREHFSEMNNLFSLSVFNSWSLLLLLFLLCSMSLKESSSVVMSTNYQGADGLLLGEEEEWT